jgi:hypothetical protein
LKTPSLSSEIDGFSVAKRSVLSYSRLSARIVFVGSTAFSAYSILSKPLVNSALSVADKPLNLAAPGPLLSWGSSVATSVPVAS